MIIIAPKTGSEKLSSGRRLARGEHYFPSLEGFPFSFPRKGMEGVTYTVRYALLLNICHRCHRHHLSYVYIIHHLQRRSAIIRVVNFLLSRNRIVGDRPGGEKEKFSKFADALRDLPGFSKKRSPLSRLSTSTTQLTFPCQGIFPPTRMLHITHRSIRNADAGA
jgi:hypothetical protein